MKSAKFLPVYFIALCISLALNVASAAESHIDKIIERGFILVGTTGDYKPFSYYNEQSKKFEGHDIDAAKHLAESMGVEIKFVKTTWKTLVQGIIEQKYDVAMSGITRNLSRQKQVALTAPYIKVGKSPLIRLKDKERFKTLNDIDQRGVKIGVNPGGTNERFVRANIKKANIIMIDENLEIPNHVLSGEVDVMITDNIEAILAARNSSKLYAVSPSQTFTQDDFGYMLARDDFAFLSWMNLWIYQMNEKGEFDKLKKKWISE